MEITRLTIFVLILSQRLRTCSLPDLRMLFKTATSGRTQTSDEEQGETDEDEHGDEEENADEQGDLEGDEELDEGNEEHDDCDDEDDDDNDDNEDDDEDDDDDEDEELNVGRFARVKRKCLSMHLQGICSSLTLLFFFRKQEVMNVLLFAQLFTNSSLYFKNIIFWVFYFAYSAFGTWFDFDPKLFEDITSPND